MNRLEAIDEFLKTQNKIARVVIYFLCSLGFIAFCYFMVVIDTQEEVSRLQQKKEQKQKKLENLQKNVTIKKLKRLRAKVDTFKTSIQAEQDAIDKKTASLNNAKAFFIDDVRFSNYMKDFLKQSETLGVKLEETKFLPSKDTFMGLLSIKRQMQLSGTGEFLDILRLFRYLEEQKFLIQAYYIKIYKKDDKVRFLAIFDVIGL